MTLQEVGMLFDKIVGFYPQFAGDLVKMRSWHEVLGDTHFDQAVKSLVHYAAKPESKYPPHPGALVATESAEGELYHAFMRTAGRAAVDESSQIQATGVPPTADQRRKVRELLASRLR
ncbi:hypothetical protein I8J29_24630 [Paenibacillus sp. MWE-103]|uniref:Loader and inhibitor of G40P protein n=1 Tax=Paenibacillus artemisiicola TaxID=1172618 RepID=A0ABS3WGA8_9BACL|nr:hypothetical protein [Paenibacillus artemisiicola]MBO7747376.1 hypothetical protein [Paenibacillus artemisiicola]